VDRGLAAKGQTLIGVNAIEQRPGRYVKLLASFTVAAILFSVGLLLWRLHDRELKRALMETSNLTQLVRQQAERQFEGVDMVLTAVQERLQTPFGSQQDLAGDSVRLLLNSRVAGMNHVRAVFLLDRQGLLVNASRNFAPAQSAFDHTDYFRAVASDFQKNALFISKPGVGADGGWTLFLARPVRDSAGQWRGVVVAAIGLSEFEHLYSAIQLDNARPIGFYLADGTLFASWPPRANEVGRVAPELGSELPMTDQLAVTVHAIGGDKHRIAMGRLNGYPLWVSVSDSEYRSLALWRETAWPLGAGAVLVSLFIVLVAMYLTGKLRLKQQLSMALHAADQRYQHTVNSVMDAIVAVDESMQVVLFNTSAEKMFGYSAQAVIGQPLDMLIPPRLQMAHREHVRQFTGGTPVSRATALQTEIIGLRSDGAEFPLESTISRSLVGGKIQMTAVLRDATERRRAESELRLANSQLRELSASLQSVREEERKRISRELHDDLGQQLTGLKLSLSWLGSRLKDGKPATASDVDEMRHQMDAAIGSVRRLATELRPRVLDDVDFREALTWQTEEFFKHSGIQMELNLQGAEHVQGDTLATALFRIVQEALTNVVRHAQATQVKLSLHKTDSGLQLGIEDNGCGFDTHANAGGVGLVSMRERCGAIGAHFSVHSAPGQGTRIAIDVPFAASSGAPVIA